MIPILYLKGISTGRFEKALTALLGKDPGGLSASTIARLKDAWVDGKARWLKRDPSVKRYVYFWVDGIHLQARLEDDAQWLLVIIGATPGGNKELVGLIDGVRENAQSWKGLLLDLKRRGLVIGPELAVADGALGFWQAIERCGPRLVLCRTSGRPRRRMTPTLLSTLRRDLRDHMSENRRLCELDHTSSSNSALSEARDQRRMRDHLLRHLP